MSFNHSNVQLLGLVVLTTLSGFYMGLHSPLDWTLLTATLLGTALTSGSATTINQLLEVPFDSQMKRTQNRPLVLGRISPLHAFGFAAISGVTGLTLLSWVNPLTAVLGATNLVLYSFIYTPMKRAHIANTWVGAIVGAIPPVMGFTAVNNYIGINSDWHSINWCLPIDRYVGHTDGSTAVFVAIPALQRLVVEYETRVREGWLSNDVRHWTQTMSEHSVKTFVSYSDLQYAYVHNTHDMDFCVGLTAT